MFNRAAEDSQESKPGNGLILSTEVVDPGHRNSMIAINFDSEDENR
jgi:hypothetical protein